MTPDDYSATEPMAAPDEAAMDDDDGGMEDAPDLGDLDLHTRGLVKRYGGRRVVDGVSIGLSRGEVVGLLGPNGAGKTTSFYMVVGLIQPNEGHVYLDGHDITRLRMHRRARRGIGYLAQSSSVFRKLSVWDNIMAILELQPLSKTERLQRCEDLLERLKVGHLRASMGESLSGGERRRVEIARCLASDPSFILLDEPFTGVDPRAIQDIQDIVSEPGGWHRHPHHRSSSADLESRTGHISSVRADPRDACGFVHDRRPRDDSVTPPAGSNRRTGSGAEVTAPT